MKRRQIKNTEILLNILYYIDSSKPAGTTREGKNSKTVSMLRWNHRLLLLDIICITIQKQKISHTDPNFIIYAQGSAVCILRTNKGRGNYLYTTTLMRLVCIYESDFRTDARVYLSGIV